MLFWIYFIIFISLLNMLFWKKYNFFVWIILALVGMFRYRVGTDYIEYEYIYTAVIHGDFVPVELGYKLLIIFIDYIGGNAQMVFAITFSLTTFLFYKGFLYWLKILNKENYLPIVLLLYIFIIFYFSLTSVRQILAISIFWYASKYIYQKKIDKYILWMIVAIMIHMSVFFLLVTYWFFQKKLSQFHLFIIALLSSILIIYNPVPLISSFFSIIGGKYARFFEMEFFLEVGSSSFKIILTIVTMVIIIFFLKILDRKKLEENIIFNAMILFIITRIISLHMDVINRVSNLFKPFLIIFLIIIFSKLLLKIKNMRQSILFLILLLLVFLNVMIITEKANRNPSFNHYTINIKLFGYQYNIIPIYGNYKNSDRGAK